MSWYAGGLRFACTQCGKCCTGAPGHTWISEAETDALAARLGLTREDFLARYTRRIWRQGAECVSLIEKPGYDCIFFERGRGCTVYDLRPRQCRTWPFWRPNLRSPDDWSAAARGCPGMNQGPLHDARTIAGIADDDGLA